jgi:sugar lactone lactonase YvrE
VTFAAAACGGGPEELADAVLTGFATPESALHDEQRDVYLVSNIRGQPTAKDGNGSISRVTPTGAVDHEWVVGGRNGVELHAPKGLAIAGRVLYVADIDVVRKFDADTGAPLGSVAVPGATFLNDVSVAPDGALWITDTGLNADFTPSGTAAVHVLSAAGEVRKVAAGADLGLPNGIFATAAGAYVVTWDRGEFLQVDGAGRRTVLARTEHAQLTGLVRLGADRWLCTSWAGRCIYAFDTVGRVQPLAGGSLEQPADLGYDQRRSRLLVPLFGRNEVLLRRL